MPPKVWSPKSERQYQHVKESLEERGKPESQAEEIAARVVNKERARSGEAAEASQRGLQGRSKMNKAALEQDLKR